jgi:hypothetical protein
MGYSNDLRVRVIRVVEGGVAARAAARDARPQSAGLLKHGPWASWMDAVGRHS